MEKKMIDAERIIEDMKRYAPNTQYDIHEYRLHGNEIRFDSLIQDTIGLIQCLRSENADLKEENDILKENIIAECKEHEEFTLLAKKADEQQKAEIERLNLAVEGITAENKVLHKENGELIEKVERLTEERERVAWTKQEYLDWVHGLLSTHTEMKDRGEDCKMFDRDWLCGILWAKIESAIEYIIDLENQRNELEKQVDELNLELLRYKNLELKVNEESYNQALNEFVTMAHEYLKHVSFQSNTAMVKVHEIIDKVQNRLRG